MPVCGGVERQGFGGKNWRLNMAVMDVGSATTISV